MAPKASKAPVKPAGTLDIRRFMGSSAEQKPSQSSQPRSSGTTLKTPIEICDTDDETPKASKSQSTSKPPAKSPAKPKPTATKPKDTSMDIDNVPQAPKKRKSNVMLFSSDEEDEPPRKKAAIVDSKTTSTKPKPKSISPVPIPVVKRKGAMIIDSDEDETPPPPPAKKALVKARPSVTHAKENAAPDSAAKPKKVVKKAKERYESEEEEEEEKPKKPKAKPAPKASKAKESKDTVAAEAKNKSNFVAYLANKSSGPSAPGSKEIPVGQPNCLAGLAFVFTGELTSLSRDEAQDLAKRYGARVTGQPSSKTSYVVVGDNAGPSKLAAIAKHNLPSITEDDFLAMIATRRGVLDEKAAAKLEKEEEKIKEQAKEFEKLEKKAEKQAAKAGIPTNPAAQLWTTRYAPQSLKDVCGNKGQIEKLGDWLRDWDASLACGFNKPGKHGINMYRAVLIYGPPGIGKTTSAHLVATLQGYTPIEVNASDVRSKKLIENGTNIQNTSLDGWMHGKGTTNVAGTEITNKTVLIMDEVDGMSAGDRGGVGALNLLIKKTKIPIICIANDEGSQKLKPLMKTTFKLGFRKPDAAAIRSRMMSIAFKEKLKIPAPVMDQLVTGAQSDMRQVLNMLSTWKLSSNTMDFDEGKNLVKMNEKYAVLSPFNCINKLIGPYLFSATARETLNEKMELYFHDHSFMPLFVQENYLKTQPARVRNLDGPDAIMKRLELMDKAASSISDGDIVDSMIHGSEQHWTLMPLHAVTSTVRPASFIYGTGGGYGGPNAVSFPGWLGQNSKQTKLQRALGDVQIRMRLKVSGNRSEIRQSYIPALFPKMVGAMVDGGSAAVPGVIETMDEYYLSKEDWDTIVELGVGDQAETTVLKKIPTATKTALTKKYNSTDHPIPFHKQELGKPAKKIAADAAPDCDDIFDADDTIPEEDEKEDTSSSDPLQDKLIKQAGAKGKGKAAEGKGKAPAKPRPSTSQPKKKKGAD